MWRGKAQTVPVKECAGGLASPVKHITRFPKGDTDTKIRSNKDPHQQIDKMALDCLAEKSVSVKLTPEINLP